MLKQFPPRRSNKNASTHAIPQPFRTQPSRQVQPADYSVYAMSRKEWIFSAGGAIFSLFCVGLLFYDHFLLAGAIACLGLLYPRHRAVRQAARKKAELTVQFKQALSTLSSSLTAGKSVENAFATVVTDMDTIYPDPETPILAEFNRMNRRIANGDTLENALTDFARRAAVEDIDNFAQVFVTCKRSGGNLVEVIRRTSNMIAEKIDMQQEIAILVAQKKFESTVLAIAPLLIVGMLRVSSPDYLQPLYEGMVGRGLMTIALLLFAGCIFLSRKIMTIQV